MVLENLPDTLSEINKPNPDSAFKGLLYIIERVNRNVIEPSKGEGWEKKWMVLDF